MLHLQTFGGLRLTDANGSLIRYPVKGLLLIVYIFTRSSHELNRNELAEFLWADVEADLARLNLRKLVSRIRQIDGGNTETPLHFTSTSICLRMKALTVDLQVLDAPKPPLERLRAISDLLQRDFIGSLRSATRSIDAWITKERRNQRLKLREALFDALPDAQANGDFRTISNAGLHLLERDSSDEEIRAILRQLPGTSRIDDNEIAKAGGAKIHAAPSSAQSWLRHPELDDLPSSILPRMVLLPPTSPGNAAGLLLASALIEDVTDQALCSSKHLHRRIVDFALGISSAKAVFSGHLEG